MLACNSRKYIDTSQVRLPRITDGRNNWSERVVNNNEIWLCFTVTNVKQELCERYVTLYWIFFLFYCAFCNKKLIDVKINTDFWVA